MGFGNFFGLPSSSSSSPSSSRPQGGYRPPLGPGSSKVDYSYGLNQSGPSTSPGYAQGYHRSDHDAPPPYHPQDGPDINDWAPDSKMSVPHKTHTDAIQFPAPDKIHNQGASGGEDPLQALFKYDVFIILDDSSSMLAVDNRGGKTRWDQAWDALETLVKAGIEYCTNGIEIRFLNDRDGGGIVKKIKDLKDLRRNTPAPGRNYTPTGDVLDMYLLEYRSQTTNIPRRGGVKKRIFIVITDGAASDAPEDVIASTAIFYQKNHFPLDQVGIQFIQVGNDTGAGKFLDELDTNLVEHMGENGRDIVDTMKSNGRDLEGDSLVKALIGAVNRKHDRVGEK